MTTLNTKPLFVVTVGILILSGCTSLAPTKELSDVSMLVHERTGETLVWDPTLSPPKDINAEIQSTLSQPLTMKSTVRLALLNNSALRAAYAELGIGRADLVQAGLVHNPLFEAAVKFPQGGHSLNLDLGITLELLDILFVSLKTEIAESELDAKKAEVAGFVIGLIADVRDTFVSIQAAQQIENLFEQAVTATAASSASAAALYEAGNINQLTFDTERYFHEENQLAQREANIRTLEAREQLNTLLGLNQTTQWTLSLRLPSPSLSEANDGIERLALDASLELAAARAKLLALGATHRIKNTTALIPVIEAGGGAERNEREWEAGPSFAVTLPILDWGTARRAKSRAEIIRAQEHYIGLQIAIAATAKIAYARLEKERHKVSFYQKTVLPLQFQILDQTLHQYNAMQIGIFELLSAKREQIAAGQAYIYALRDFWMAQHAVDEILAGRLPSIQPFEAFDWPRVSTGTMQGGH